MGSRLPDLGGTHSLLVLNISFRTTPEELREEFRRFGNLADVYIPRSNGNSRGYAFVRYYSKEEADDACVQMNKKQLDGREIQVQFARYGRNDRDRQGPAGGAAYRGGGRREYERSPTRPYRSYRRERSYSPRRRDDRERERDRYDDRERERERDRRERSPYARRADRDRMRERERSPYNGRRERYVNDRQRYAYDDDDRERKRPRVDEREREREQERERDRPRIDERNRAPAPVDEREARPDVRERERDRPSHANENDDPRDRPAPRDDVRERDRPPVDDERERERPDEGRVTSNDEDKDDYQRRKSPEKKPAEVVSSAVPESLAENR